VARELAARSVSARRRKAQEAKDAAEIKTPKDSANLVKELARLFVDLRCGGLEHIDGAHGIVDRLYS
jgi:hypothetical protein